MSAQKIIAEIDATIAKLQAVRAAVDEAGDALNGWSTSSGGVLLSPLLQLHRGKEVEEPKIAAKALAPTWTREIGGKWKADLAAVPGMQIILHGAEPEDTNPTVLRL